MSFIQFVVAVLALLGCVYLWNTYIAPQGMKVFGTVVLVVLVVIVILTYCGVSGLLGLR